MNNKMKPPKSINRLLFEWIVNSKFSFTGIGAAIGIVALYTVWSIGPFVEPNIVVWGSAAVVGSAVGGCVDAIQSYLGKYI